MYTPDSRFGALAPDGRSDMFERASAMRELEPAKESASRCRRRWIGRCGMGMMGNC